MNRTTKIQSLQKLNEKELKLGYTGDERKSWHQDYKDSAWVYIGGLPYELNEGDIIQVFSQYGEVVNINLVRDRESGKSKGFCFLCYQDQRSTILAVDNLNGITLCKRLIQVDHCANYRVPKFKESVQPELRNVWEHGCAPKPLNLPEEKLKSEARAEKRERKKKLKAHEELVPLADDDVSKEMKKLRKRLKKERKEQRRQEKREKRLRERTPDAERGTADDEGRWDAKKKRLDEEDMRDDNKFYGASGHFNFGSKKHKPVPPPPSHNLRPDFEKADWRDVEMFKLIREHEKREKGDKPNTFKEETHYVPKRLGGEK